MADIDWSKEWSYRKCCTSGGSSITIDSVLSTTSTNPVQNKTITTEMNTVKNQVSSLNMTLTQSEYDALSDAEKNNGTYYFIVESDYDV